MKLNDFVKLYAGAKSDSLTIYKEAKGKRKCLYERDFDDYEISFDSDYAGLGLTGADYEVIEFSRFLDEGITIVVKEI